MCELCRTDIPGRLELFPEGMGGDRGAVDYAAWLEFCRAYGLLEESTPDEWGEDWAEMLAQCSPDHSNPPDPTVPSSARPGSPEKLAVLRLRFRRQEALWHPRDARQPTRGDLLALMQERW